MRQNLCVNGVFHAIRRIACCMASAAYTSERGGWCGCAFCGAKKNSRQSNRVGGRTGRGESGVWVEDRGPWDLDFFYFWDLDFIL